jgi:hypothetical protein
VSLNRRTLLLGSSITAVPWRGMRADLPVSPITNRWGEASSTNLPVGEVLVFQGRAGAAYSHHPQIAFDRGRLHLSWSLGVQHEDFAGQKMVFSTSDDGGRTWSEERPIVAPQADPGSVYTAMGIRAYEGKLISYYGHYAYTPLGLDAIRVPAAYGGVDFRNDPKTWVHRDAFCDVRISEDRGGTWGKPIRILEKFVPNLRPLPVRGGRLIMPGNISFPYTDDPAGISNWKRAGLPRSPEWTVDDSEGFHKLCGSRGDPYDYCEGSFYQTDDGRIHMLLRIDPLKGQKHNGRLAVTESLDNGKTWSEPVLTNYSDSACRFQFGRLPDGRYFGLSCPKPGSGRTPLVLALSRDGVVFDRHYILGDVPSAKPRMAGNHKGGVYGYPSCDIAEGRMYLTWSRSKEDVYFGSFQLSALS